MITRSTDVQARQPKIPPIRIESDDCAVYLGRVIEDGKIIGDGTPHYIHQGEWVELVPYGSIGEMMAATSFAPQDTVALQSEKMRNICVTLARRVTGWNWTDIMGAPLPQPYGRPEIFEALSADEIVWLIGASQKGEGVAERKNGSGPSGSASSGKGRSHRKRTSA